MKKLILVAIIIFLLLTIKNSITSITSLIKNGSLYAQLQAEHDQAQAKNKLLNQQLYYVKKDDFVEKVAREKLGLVRKGEYVILAPRQGVSTNEPLNTEIPHWEKWLSLFL